MTEGKKGEAMTTCKSYNEFLRRYFPATWRRMRNTPPEDPDEAGRWWAEKALRKAARILKGGQRAQERG